MHMGLVCDVVVVDKCIRTLLHAHMCLKQYLAALHDLGLHIMMLSAKRLGQEIVIHLAAATGK